MVTVVFRALAFRARVGEGGVKQSPPSRISSEEGGTTAMGTVIKNKKLYETYYLYFSFCYKMSNYKAESHINGNYRVPRCDSDCSNLLHVTVTSFRANSLIGKELYSYRTPFRNGAPANPQWHQFTKFKYKG